MDRNEGRQRQCGVGNLVFSRERTVKPPVTLSDAVVGKCPVPMDLCSDLLPQEAELRFPFPTDRLQGLDDPPLTNRGEANPPLFDDPALFPCDFFQRITEVLPVLQGNVCNHRDEWGNHIGCIQPSSHARLQNGNIRLSLPVV